jgi:hypothetical protein
MQRLEVSGVVRLIEGSLGFKGLTYLFWQINIDKATISFIISYIVRRIFMRTNCIEVLQDVVSSADFM